MIYEKKKNETKDTIFCHGADTCVEVSKAYFRGLKEKKLPWRNDIPVNNGFYVVQLTNDTYEIREIGEDIFNLNDVKKWLYLG